MRYIFNILKYNENKFPYLNVGMGLAPPRPCSIRSPPYPVPTIFDSYPVRVRDSGNLSDWERESGNVY